MASKRLDPNASLADYKEHVARKRPMGNTKPKEHSARKTPMGNTKSGEHLAQKRTKIDKAIANAQAFQKQRTALINMSTKDKLGAALEAGIIGAATGGGIVAAQKGIRAAVNTGIPARIGNKVTGQTVLVHGSPVKGLKEIKPFVSNNVISNEYPGKAAVFGYKPNEIKDVRRLRYDVSNYTKVDSKIADDATIYITKVKKTGTAPAKNLVPKGVTTLPGSYAGSTPLKVVDSIAMRNKPAEIIEKELLSKIKKAGGKISKAPPATTRRP